MSLFYLLLVAVVQGITEFLPVSSSGHLVLLPALTGQADQGLAIDVAAHVGTLVAVVIFFWAEVRVAIGGVPSLARGQIDSRGAFLALCLIVATIPVILIGLVLKVTGFADAMRSVAVIGWSTIVFGLILYWTDHKGEEARTAPEWTLKHAVTMGLWQVLALIPGTSRSGVTISGARLLGYHRRDAATLSMLMSIPTILASGAILSLDVIGQANAALFRDAAIAAVFSAIAALIALKLMFKLLESVSFTPYVIYRLFLGSALLIWAYS
ncbi:Undecaprenyl-diphosphatase [Rhodobacteraceae bacterium THAF1]|uniref:undecaprenyl-diphosphate phosphatase n=1 Tax=Palleronia sp. THAF1 TaxID=2587842 RepID=UPI000F40EC37|nr:undecaprenyl-diphosphate phosphatase [Palleronia sp. THAF1]QFU10068.1 Undecaprenyl-diphosphatase [Palleronia sp. THAF1]VDC17027.1 Undecaprenyl-diphosphatase [Rhodobacteraceae bacterium THAF1]